MMRSLRLSRVATDAVLYAVATGLNRGAMLLTFPILLTFLSIEHYGIFMLTFTVSQLLVPFLTLSGTAGILREGASEAKIAVYLLEKFLGIVHMGLVVMMVIAVVLYAYGLLEQWVLYSILLGAAYAVQELFLSFYRTLNQRRHYFLLTLGKVVLIFAAIFAAKILTYDLTGTLRLLVVSQLLVIAFLLLWQLPNYLKTYTKMPVSVRSVLAYTLFVIPHGLALWVMNSSDRFLIKHFLGERELGVYSLAYTISSFQMLVNSGISMSLPQNIYKNYEYWLTPRPRLQVLHVYGCVSLLMVTFIMIGMKLSPGLLGSSVTPESIERILRYVMPGLFLVGVYQFYSTYVFYYKKTRILFLIGLFTSVFNLALNALLIPRVGVLGAAITTLVTYICYLSSVLIYVMSLEKRLRRGIVTELFVTSLYCFLMVAIIHWL